MLTGEIRHQVDRVWRSFWEGGIANSLEIIEQITYLPFIKRLDEQESLEEAKSHRLGTTMERVLFPDALSPYPRIEGEAKYRTRSFAGRVLSILKPSGRTRL